MNSTRAFALLIAALLLVYASPVNAEEGAPTSVEIRFVRHRFSPEKVEIRAGRPVTVRIVNASKERIEFESFKLNQEKVVDPGATVTLRLPALGAGDYDFFDDFHQDVPEGVIVAR